MFLERYLVRLLFCLFAEDTAIFDTPGAFSQYLRQHTREDGSDLDGALQNLFDTLNRAPDKRPKNLPHELRSFPYINGSVFAGRLEPCYFDSTARRVLLDCAEQFDWSQISPAIFGSLFQAVIHHDGEGVTAKSSKRRELGAHYTSETNILRVIGPLFLHRLQADLKTARGSKTRLKAFLERLRTLHFFDPACGCGNFLVLAYREIRRLELDAVEALLALEQRQRTVSGTLDAKEFEQIQCDVHQCHGIEIEASAAHIATVALWLTDHQENLRASRALGGHFNRLPLVRKANIVQGNALTLDWAEVLPPAQCSYVIGNPPFIGAKFMNDAQREETRRVLLDVHNAGLLDFVAAWYVKAARYVRGESCAGVTASAAVQLGQMPSAHTDPTAPKSLSTSTPATPGNVRCAFVSTNSITQGEQVGVLWGWMLAQGIKIQFAHRTFQWSNDAKGVAAVHCVIVGFGLEDRSDKVIYHYPDIRGEPEAVAAQKINPYLVDAPDVLISAQKKVLCPVPQVVYGSFALDNGNFTIDITAREQLLAADSRVSDYLRPFIGGEEFLHGTPRWCLWLSNANPMSLRAITVITQRIEAVRQWRASRDRATTKKLAQTPMLFAEIRQPNSSYIAIPTVSSERRNFIPIGLLDKDVIASNQLYVVPNANLCYFGILSSTMHNAWVRATCGRLKSDLRYSAAIVYNNFPWPDLPDSTPERPAPAAVQKRRLAIETAAQAVLDASAQFADSTLADLYDPLTMPAGLIKAHQQLDKAVDAAYGYKGQPDDAARVAFLFARYQALTAATAPVLPVKPTRRRRV